MTIKDRVISWRNIVLEALLIREGECSEEKREELVNYANGHVLCSVYEEVEENNYNIYVSVNPSCISYNREEQYRRAAIHYYVENILDGSPIPENISIEDNGSSVNIIYSRIYNR